MSLPFRCITASRRRCPKLRSADKVQSEMGWGKRSIQSAATMIGEHIELILIVTGALTTVALLQFITPASVLLMIYGEAPTDDVGLAVARHWGLLTFLVGALLVYAAFHPSVRGPATVIALIEKTALGLGILGTSLRTHSVAAAIAAGDSLIALIYILYLAGF